MRKLLRAKSVLLGAGIAFAGLCGVPQAQEVTLEQVLANPGDYQLTYTYARQQIRSGELEQAAGALERLLLLEPNWDSARFLYAIVLYRLDDMEGAKRELGILQGRPLTTSDADQVERYLGMVEKKSSAFRVSGSVSIGVGVDSNPALATSSETGFFGEALDPDERVDGSFIAASTLRIERDLDTGRGDFLFMQLTGRLTEQFEVNSADYMRGEVKAGGTFFFGDFSLTPEAFYAAVGLDHDLTFHEAGGRLRAEYLVTPGFALVARAGGSGLYYDEDSADEDRDGWRAHGGAGIRARFSDHNTFEAGATYHRREAESDPYSYDAVEISLSDRHLLGLGQYLLGEFTYWHLNYDEELEIDMPEREDDRFKVRLAYGLPVSTLVKAFGADGPSALDTFNLQVSGSYYHQDSNIPNFDSENWSGELLLTKRFGF